MKINMSDKIYEVRRENLPETNSSSSHSVVIDSLSPRDSLPGSPYWDLPIDEEGFIHIPPRSFGRESEKFNSVLCKVQYVAGLMISSDFSVYCRRLRSLAVVLIEISGAKDVIFDWFPNTYNDLQRSNGDPYYEDPGMWWSLGCDIDHQSMDLDEEVLESPETLKNFLLKSSSWLFLEDDSFSDEYISPSKLESGVYKQHDPEAYIVVDVGGDIGRIDIPVDSFPLDFPIDDYFRVSWFGEGIILQNICFVGGKPQSVSPGCVSQKGALDYKGLLKEGFVYWASERFTNALVQKLTEALGNQGQARFSAAFGSTRKNGEDAMILELQKEMPDDIVIIPYKIETKEFGEVPA